MRNGRFIRFGLPLAIGLVLASAADGALSRGSEPAAIWIADGTVSTVAATPGGVYVGGDFSLLGPLTGSWVDVRASGSVIPARKAVSGAVSVAVSDGGGGWFLRGEINGVGGVSVRGVVHLRSNGTLDPKWRLVSNGEIDALARFGTTLYVGGMFTSLSGSRRNGIAAVDTRTNSVLPGLHGWRRQRTTASRGSPRSRSQRTVLPCTSAAASSGWTGSVGRRSQPSTRKLGPCRSTRTPMVP